MRTAAVLAGAMAVVGTAEASAQECRFMTPEVRKENRDAARTVERFEDDAKFTVRTKTFRPKIAKTRGFTGYGSVVLRAPKGTTPSVGTFRLRGADPCSIEITSAQVVLRRYAYVVRFKAPGEQGDPGRITVVLLSD